jgi:hypothetical protein
MKVDKIHNVKLIDNDGNIIKEIDTMENSNMKYTCWKCNKETYKKLVDMKFTKNGKTLLFQKYVNYCDNCQNYLVSHKQFKEIEDEFNIK